MMKRLQASCALAAEPGMQHTTAGMRPAAALSYFDTNLSVRRDTRMYT